MRHAMSRTGILEDSLSLQNGHLFGRKLGRSVVAVVVVVVVTVVVAVAGAGTVSRGSNETWSGEVALS